MVQTGEVTWAFDKEDVLAALLNSTRSLDTLTLDDESFGAQGVHEICEAMKQNTTLVSLSMNCKMGELEVQGIAAMLRGNTSLTSLSLSGVNFTRLGEQSMRAFAAGIKANKGLSSVCLKRTGIDDASLGILVEQALCKHPSLINLDLEGNPCSKQRASHTWSLYKAYQQNNQHNAQNRWAANVSRYQIDSSATLLHFIFCMFDFSASAFFYTDGIQSEKFQQVHPATHSVIKPLALCFLAANAVHLLWSTLPLHLLRAAGRNHHIGGARNKRHIVVRERYAEVVWFKEKLARLTRRQSAVRFLTEDVFAIVIVLVVAQKVDNSWNPVRWAASFLLNFVVSLISLLFGAREVIVAIRDTPRGNQHTRDMEDEGLTQESDLVSMLGLGIDRGLDNEIGATTHEQQKRFGDELEQIRCEWGARAEDLDAVDTDLERTSMHLLSFACMWQTLVLEVRWAFSQGVRVAFCCADTNAGGVLVEVPWAGEARRKEEMERRKLEEYNRRQEERKLLLQRQKQRQLMTSCLNRMLRREFADVLARWREFVREQSLREPKDELGEGELSFSVSRAFSDTPFFLDTPTMEKKTGRRSWHGGVLANDFGSEQKVIDGRRMQATTSAKIVPPLSPEQLDLELQGFALDGSMASSLMETCAECGSREVLYTDSADLMMYCEGCFEGLYGLDWRVHAEDGDAKHGVLASFFPQLEMERET
jgi:hypothetical protein